VKYTDLSINYPKGEKFRWWSFTSSTTLGSVVENFLGTTGLRTLVLINSQTGVDINPISALPESEVLFRPGTKFEVVNVIKASPDLVILHLDEIPDNIPLQIQSKTTPEKLIPNPLISSNPQSVAYQIDQLPLQKSIPKNIPISSSLPTTDVSQTNIPIVTQNKGLSSSYNPQTTVVIPDISGNWTTHDLNTKELFHYQWVHTDRATQFTGQQNPSYKINGNIKPSLDKNKIDIEWTFTDLPIRCCGQLDITTMKIKGKYFNSTNQVGEFTGEKSIIKLPNISGTWKTQDSKKGDCFIYQWVHEEGAFHFNGQQNPSYKINGYIKPSLEKNKIDIEWSFADFPIKCCGQLDIITMKIMGKYYNRSELLGEFTGERNK